MTFTSKIALLKNFINSTYSSYATTLNSTAYTGEYANSIIHALRTIGKKAKICAKTIWIPIVPNIYYYDLYPSLYSKEKVDFVKPSALALTSFEIDSDGMVQMSNLDIDITTIEGLESGKLNYLVVAQKNIQTTSAIKLRFGEYETVPTFKGKGGISATSSPKLIKILKTNCSSQPLAGDTVYNLDAFDTKLQYSIDTIASVADGTTTWDLTMTNDVVLTTGNYKWTTTDIIAISTGDLCFISFTMQMIPKLDYLTADGDLSNEIPIIPQFLDDIDAVCYKYLFGILTVRDPDKVSIYTSLIQSGLIKSEKEVITDIKARVKTVDPIVVNSYQPY
jgi:hypothetical protein